MARKELVVDNVAEAYLALLAERGIEYLFANAGTDFAPLVEAFAKAARTGMPVPQPVLAAHENLALSMAHGYAMVSRRVPAVMVHVSVGTANGVCGALNAARENVPMLFTAGRSPLTEGGLPGARDVYIHWAQEMFDQAGMLREIVKWEYELRNGQQLETVIDRALAVATTPPGGPVYLSLPREVLAAPLPGFSYDAPARRVAAAPAAADKGAIQDAARILAAAENPLIITASAGRDPAAVGALADLAQRFAIPVVQHRPRHLCLPAEHPCHLGYDAAPFLDSAAAILVLECDVPWIPSLDTPQRECKVIHIGVDPLFSRYPIRGFPCDLALTGSAASALPELAEALDRCTDSSAVAARRRRLAEQRENLLAGWQKTRDSAAGGASDPHGLGQRLHRPGQTRGCDHRQRIHLDTRALRLEPSGYLFWIEHGLGSRLGWRRRPWGQAGLAGPLGDCRARRRLASIRQPRRRPSRLGDAQIAGSVHRPEQFDVGRRASRDAWDVPARRSGTQ